jgi:hypothetical protein
LFPTNKGRAEFLHASSNRLMTMCTSTSSLERSFFTQETDEDSPDVSLWEKTSLYLAPSINGEGWGVFAARRFSQGEIVELAPMFLRFEERAPFLKETILSNYHYEYWAWTGGRTVLQTSLSFGYTLYYNHSPNANIQYQEWGNEPQVTDIHRAAVVGYFAVRDIEEGEELVNDYCGLEWFEQQGLTMIDLPMSAQQLQNPFDLEEKYRSKLFSGLGMDIYQKVLDCHAGPMDIGLYYMESIVPYLPRKSAGYGNVTAKERVDAGETLVYAPALVISKEYVQTSTVLDAIVIQWNCLEPVGIKTVSVQYQPDSLGFEAPTQRQIPLEETVLFPLAGNIALLSRNLTNFNARIEVEPDEYNKDSFCLRVVATKSIEVGQVVTVKLPSPCTESLVEELALTGQPMAPSLFSESPSDSF